MDTIELYAKHQGNNWDSKDKDHHKFLKTSEVLLDACLEKARDQPDCLMKYNVEKNMNFTAYYPHLLNMHSK